MKKIGSMAIVQKGNKVLLVLEPEWAAFGGHWNLPGGGVNPGETLEAAAAREVLEETGVKCKITSYFYKEINQFNYDISVFTAKYVSGTLKVQKKENDDARWFSQDEIKNLSLAYSTKDVLSKYFKSKK